MIAYSAYKGYKANKEKKAHEGGNAAPDEMQGISSAAEEHYAPPQQQQQQQQQYTTPPPQHEKPQQQQQQQYETTTSTHRIPQYSHSVQPAAYVYPLVFHIYENGKRGICADVSYRV